ncbi:MAG: CRISPR-associated endonuclease Cas1, partial [Candidatus Freyarchaeota archaeon]|nr:CRISPR-associated endonuclease Cas1 [Candidatus Jordarchaeia archaeon]
SGVFQVRIFLDDFGIFLGRKRNRFVVRKGDEEKEFVADEVEGIVCTCPGVSFSASALRLAVKSNVQVVFADYGGWPYAVLMPASLSGSVRARREQFLAYNDKRGFLLAKEFVRGKLRNQANLLKLLAKNRRDRAPALAGRLYEAGKEVDRVAEEVWGEEAASVDSGRQRLMALEAAAAKIYWEAVGEVLPAELGFEGRVTRGATDPFNVMLNFGYQAVLFPEVWKAVCYAGLDPYAGFLHADRSGKPSMVLDLMEEFRQQVVDRTLVSLLSTGVLKPNELASGEEAKEGRILSRRATEKLAEAILERMEAPVMLNGRREPIRGFIHIQARMVVRFLTGEAAKYHPFIVGW